jgi:predicted Holliday junction resolvase-like endonuclease
MINVLYFLLMILVFLIIKVYYLRENLTMQELETQTLKTDKNLKQTQSEFKSFMDKYEEDQKRMKDASDKATSAQAALSAAAH